MTTSLIYIAGPLFSFAERNFNESMVNNLRKFMPKTDFLLPQVYAERISGQNKFMEKMFKYCLTSIGKVDAVLCILDGPDVDSGTCIEIGYAYANKKPILGVRNDFRNSEHKGVNLMVSHICTEMLRLPSNEVNLTEFFSEIVKGLNRILKIE